MYRNLAPERIVETAGSLCRRIEERFPGSGLSRVATEVAGVAGEAAGLSEWLSRRNLPLRLAAGAGILVILAVLIGALAAVRVKLEVASLPELLQGTEAAINEVVFLGIAVYFFLSLETRLKRRRALKAIHVLRSLAHIIDMHQLTKDPDRVLRRGPDTASSPARTLTPFELTRYLDYCTELLAILSKIAAVYVQRFDDPATLSAVNDVEDLANGLSRKIWQKIVILDRILAPDTSQVSMEAAVG